MWADAALVMDGSYLYAVAVIVSCVVFMFLEHLAFQDALYFTLISTSTVGFGDYVPHTPEGKIFLCILLPVAIPVCCRNMYPLGTAAFSTARSLVGTLQSAEERRPSSVRTPLDEDSIGRKTYATCALALALVVAPGAYLCHRFLAMDYVDATYFMTTSVLTVGYGDIVPTTLKSQMLTAFYLMIGCGTALVAAEAIYLHEKAKVVRTTDLRKFIDQVVLQETCWDSSWAAAAQSRGGGGGGGSGGAGGGAGGGSSRSRRPADGTHVLALTADGGGGLSEAEFVLAALTAHEVVDVATLVALRKQFAALMLAAKAAAPAESAESARATDGGDAGADEGGEWRLDARSVFRIFVGDGRVRHRTADVARGSTIEEGWFGGLPYFLAAQPVALVDLRAPDGGYAEWMEHFWSKKVGEYRDKVVAEVYGGDEGLLPGGAGAAAAAAAAPGPAVML